MSQASGGNRRIAKNALMLYIRMLISMIVSLYTSRVILNVLGVEDYGTYGIVGGVVGMLGFLNASMSGATSRFLTFELGRGNMKRLSDTFASALIAHIGIAIIVFVIAETIGLWFLLNKLVIPEGRMTAAHWVYQMSIVSAMIGITQVPYNATIMAHEKMDVYAYMEILSVTLKLLIVYLLTIGNFDKLILYGALVLMVSITIRMIYRIYCIRHFEESHFHWVWDKSIMKPLLGFSGWDLYGNMAFTIRMHGANFIINTFYGVALNAACSVAATVQGILMGFSTNVISAFRPQIIKNYAVGDYKGMNEKIFFATKIAITLLVLVTVPVYVKCSYVLKLWLKTVPDGTVALAHVTLLMNLATCMSLIVLIGIHATGKMIRTGAFGGTLYILTLPIMYVMLRLGMSYLDCYFMFLVMTCLFFIVNTLILRHQMREFQTRRYVLTVVAPLFLFFTCDLALAYYVSSFFEDTFLGLLVFVLISVLLTVLLGILIVFNKKERGMVKEMLLGFVRRLF